MRKIRSISTLTAVAAASAVAVAGPASAGPQASAATAGAKKDIVETAVEAGQVRHPRLAAQEGRPGQDPQGQGPVHRVRADRRGVREGPAGDPR